MLITLSNFKITNILYLRWLHEHSRYYDIRIIYNLTSTNSYQHQHYHNIIWYIYKYFPHLHVSDHLKSKAPHPIPHWEVKSLQAWLVLSWGTRREVHVLLTFLLLQLSYYFYKKTFLIIYVHYHDNFSFFSFPGEEKARCVVHHSHNEFFFYIYIFYIFKY